MTGDDFTRDNQPLLHRRDLLKYGGAIGLGLGIVGNAGIDRAEASSGSGFDQGFDEGLGS